MTPRSSTPRAAALLLLALAATACDPIIHVRGTVKTAPSACAPPPGDAQAAEPIAGATVRARCPGAGADLDLGETGADGRFDFATAGLLNMQCTIFVEKRGHHAQSFLVEELCVLPFGDTACHTLSVWAELVPLPDAP